MTDKQIIIYGVDVSGWNKLGKHNLANKIIQKISKSEVKNAR